MASPSSSGDASERSQPLEDRQDHSDDETSSQEPFPGSQTGRRDSQRSAQSSSHKRRRVTRACDECRRKKIKCDGKQPCTHCTVYGYECTYDQPSYRRKNPAPQYTAALEQRLARAEAVLRTYLPNFDWNDPSLDAVLEQQGSLAASSSNFESLAKDNPTLKASSNDSNLESMVGATGQLELDNQGHWDYTGLSSGVNFMRGMRDQLGDLRVPDEGEQKAKQESRSQKSESGFSSPYKSAGPILNSPYESNYIGKEELPNKTRAKQLCSRALVDATAILEIVHQPSFYQSLDRIYDLPLEKYTNDDQKFLPLLYAVLALGCLFDADQESELEMEGYPSATGIGYKYFWASRQLLDITDCRDLVSLQAIIFMIMFLQCSAKLSTCYSYIGVALRCALRMGLHRSFRDSFSPIESESRKRAFWVIRKMDIYVGAMLGLPLALNDDDIDQEYPLEVDDEYITDKGISPMPEGRISQLSGANANFRLCKIMSKIIRAVYPIKGFQIQEHQAPGSYSVSYTVIREIEMDLQRWHESLPTDLLPAENAAPIQIRKQQLLRIAYAHAQMMLYRPFLHYISAKEKSKSVNQRCYACAAACVSVSHNITHLTKEMSRKGLLEGSYWFVMYTTFFAVLSLVFFTIENPTSSGSQDAFHDAKEGKETLAKLAERSMAADRCSTTLKSLFEQIGPIVEKGGLSTKDPSARQGDTNAEILSQKVRTSADFISEDGKIKSKNFMNSLGLSNGRGNGHQRQRGMRLISQTGRPNQARQQQHQQQQQQQQRSQSRNVAQHTTTAAQNTFPHHLRNHQQPEMFGISQPTNNGGVKAESPSATSPSSGFGMNNHIPGQDFFGQSSQYSFIPTPYQETPGASNISNFSNMMFPSDNPFQYPHPPMVTLEQNYAFNTHNDFRSSQAAQSSPTEMYLPASTTTVDTVSVDEHIDAQLFGPLPPYMNQPDSNSQHHPGSYMNLNTFAPPGSSCDVGFADAATSPHGPPPSGAEIWEQQVRSHSMAGVPWAEFYPGEAWQHEQG